MRERFVRRKPKPVSMRDIAQRAGVVPSTVSRALKNDPWIPRRTRERIKALAKEMNYVPCQAARELAGWRTRTIGACFPNLGDEALAEQAEGLDEATREHGYKLLFGLSSCHELREARCVHDFLERRMEGVVVLSPRGSRSNLDTYQRHSTPVVVIERPGPEVKATNRQIGRQAFDSLLALIEAEE